MSLQPLWPCSPFLPASHGAPDGEEQWGLGQWHLLGGNSSWAQLSWAWQGPGGVKGRDRHRVTSDAALLMGWAVSQSQHPQNPAQHWWRCQWLQLQLTQSQRLPSPQTAAAAWVGMDGRSLFSH